MVLDGVGHNNNARLEEGRLRLIGEGTRGVAADDVADSDVSACESQEGQKGNRDVLPGHLHDGALRVRGASLGGQADSNDVLRVLDGNKNAGSELKLLPSLLQVDDVDSLVVSLENVARVEGIEVLASDVDT